MNNLNANVNKQNLSFGESLLKRQKENEEGKRESCLTKEEKISQLMEEIFKIVNPNADEEIKQKTPMRYAKALMEFTQGYSDDLDDLLKDAVFKSEGYDDLIVIKDISFSSTCEHHMLPFFGECTIGYIPNEKILGLSKFPRLVQSVSRKFQLQERLTKEVADNINKYLSPVGVVVLMKASHSCMCFRGIKSWKSETQTIYTLGNLKKKENLDKFLQMVSEK